MQEKYFNGLVVQGDARRKIVAKDGEILCGALSHPCHDAISLPDMGRYFLFLSIVPSAG
jgi:hypothetical protein